MMAQLLQIRTSRDIRLENLIQKISEEGWSSIGDCLESSNGPDSRRRTFYEQICRTMEPYLHAYDLCGTATLCSEEIEGGPWLSYKDKIFILNVPEGLDDLVDNLALVGMETAADLLKPKMRRVAFNRLQRSFQKNFKSNIYYSPVCRKVEFCKFSRPVSPWRH